MGLDKLRFVLMLAANAGLLFSGLCSLTSVLCSLASDF